jgi:prephenate dehydrogenase
MSGGARRMTDSASALPFHRIAILGTGLIGGSFGLAIQKYLAPKHLPNLSLVGYDRPETAVRALKRGAVREIAPDIATAVRGANLVYVALPVGAAIEMLPLIAQHADSGPLIADACSTKEVICRIAKDYFKGGTDVDGGDEENDGSIFVGGHPMAGKESSGIDHADADLFRDAPYALIVPPNAPDARARAFVHIVELIGGKPIYCEAETHDWAVGIVSHMPQIVSIALASVVQDETDETGLPLSLAGPGLHDMLRLAGSSYETWRDILLTNTENTSRALDRLAQAIDYLRTRLASKELEDDFRAANNLAVRLRNRD